MSRPRSGQVREHDADWASSWSLRQCRTVAWQAGVAQVTAAFSRLHLVCLGVLILVLTDVAITATPAVRRVAGGVLSTLQRGEKARLARRARLRETIAARTLAGDYRSAIELTTTLVADLKSELNVANAAAAVNVLDAGDTLAGLYLRQGDHDRAESLYRQHLEILETTRTPASWAGAGVPEVLCKLARVHAARADDPRAEQLYRQALQMCDDYSSEHPFAHEILGELAALCRRTGRDAEADAWEARSRSLPAGGPSR